MPEAKERPPAMSAYTPRQADTWMREQAQREERAKDKWVQRYGYPAPDADVRDAPALPSISTRGRTSATGFHVDPLDVAAHTNTNTNTTLKHHHHHQPQPQPQPPPPQQQQQQHSARRRPSAVQPQPTTSTSNTYGNGNGNTALPPLAHNSRAVVQQSPLPIQGAAGGETKPQPPPPPFAPTAGTARMLGTSFSRFTGFYSPSFATHAPVSGSDVSGGRKQQQQQHQRHEVVAHLDPELTAKLKELRDEERCYRKKKDWMKTYADESVKFSSVTRSGGGTVRASPKQ